MNKFNKNIIAILINLALIPFYHKQVMIISIMSSSGIISYGENTMSIILNLAILLAMLIPIHLAPNFILGKCMLKMEKKKFVVFIMLNIIAIIAAYLIMFAYSYI